MKLISIGSSSSCNIHLSSEYVSSYHAELVLMDNGDIYLIDCASRNGTFLNGKRIEPNKEVSVRRGDKIEFDDVLLNWSNVPNIPILDPSVVKNVQGVGKSARNKIRLTGDKVSRYHATIKQMKDGKWFIQDHSKNGTFVNGQKIPSDTDVRITYKDSIICADAPCPNPVPKPAINKNFATILASVAAVAAIVLTILLKPEILDIISPNRIDPAKATVMVEQSYSLKVVFDDDPLKVELGLRDWYVVENRGGVDITGNLSYANVYGHTGTAFFISDNGLLMTNHHVTDAMYAQSKSSSRMEYLKNGVFQARDNKINSIIKSGKRIDEDTLNQLIRWSNSPFHFEVVNTNYYIYYPGRTYSSRNETDRASLVVNSDDDNVDIAIIRLNSGKTPENCDYFNLSKAVTDVKDLKMDKDYYTIGYPKGHQLVTFGTDEGRYEPTAHKLHLSKSPSRYSVVFKGDMTKGGMSGSAIYDKNKRLVGVLWGGHNDDDDTIACPIIHGISLVKEVMENDKSISSFKNTNGRN